MLSRGTIVCSTAGRDCGKFSVVIKADERAVTLCDGSLHPLEKPKRKNVKHISKTLTCITEEQMSTNSKVKKALMQFGVKNVKGEI